MKTIKKLVPVLLLAVIVLVVTAWHNGAEDSAEPAEENAIVLIKFKALPDKGALAVTELKKLFEQVKKEPNFVRITMHVDPNDPTNILLYEQWESLVYYQGDHMKTPHLTAFVVSSEGFLAGPPDISFWEVNTVVE